MCDDFGSLFAFAGQLSSCENKPDNLKVLAVITHRFQTASTIFFYNLAETAITLFKSLKGAARIPTDDLVPPPKLGMSGSITLRHFSSLGQYQYLQEQFLFPVYN